jgi:DNA modification methylase
MPKSRKQNLPTAAKAAHRSLTVVPKRVADLTLNPRNPRNHSPQQIRQIARSIKTFGFNVPVLLDADGNVIAGHGRIKACQLLGWIEVPTICLEHLSEAEARAFMIADNRLTENSDWNEQLLAEQLHDLSLLDLDFSLEVTGFAMGDIDLRIEGLNSPTPHDPADELSQLPSGPPITRPGDSWVLGEHRVHCRNALEAAAYAELLQGEQAQMVFGDPPYNVRIGNVSGFGRKRHREFAMASGEMTEFDFTRFLLTATSLLAHHSAEGSLHYICIDWRHIAQLLTAAREVYQQLTNICVWVKDNAGMGSFYRSQHEFVCVFRHGRGIHRNNIQLGRYGRNRSNIWHYGGANSFSRSGAEGNLLALHPTVKPVALVADAIMDCTSRNDLVLDGFLGSGTTVIAAARTGRRCYGLEIDPLYVDVIVRRWQGVTRDTARNAMTGRSFREVEAEAQEQGWGANEPATTK